MLDVPAIQAKRLSGQRWYEIDDIQDLDIASSIFTEDDNRLSQLQKRDGGYWRYPKLMDFTEFTNPFFPPQRLLDEIKANLETIVSKKSSDMRINLLLAEKNFEIPKEKIVMVGDSKKAAKRFILNYNDEVGIIGDSNAFINLNESIHFLDEYAENLNSAADVIKLVSGMKLRLLFMENPSSRLGRYIPKNEIIKIVQWGLDNNVQVVYDETFSDFRKLSKSIDCKEYFCSSWSSWITRRNIGLWQYSRRRD